ncbi:MAG: hypothetical protein WAK31_31090 [Chthoniobacterales bacterium]
MAPVAANESLTKSRLDQVCRSTLLEELNPRPLTGSGYVTKSLPFGSFYCAARKKNKNGVKQEEHKGHKDRNFEHEVSTSTPPVEKSVSVAFVFFL